jgi:hypothetical protein
MAIWQQRHLKVSEYVQELGITRVMDIGCSNAELLVRLSRCSDLTLLVGVDVDDHAINLAKHVLVFPFRPSLQRPSKIILLSIVSTLSNSNFINVMP